MLYHRAKLHPLDLVLASNRALSRSRNKRLKAGPVEGPKHEKKACITCHAAAAWLGGTNVRGGA